MIDLETLEDRPDFLFHSRFTQPLGLDDGGQPGRRLLNFAVDQNKIVLRVVLNLFRGSPQPALNHFLAVLRPRAEPLLQNFPRRRQDENADRLRYRYLQLSRTLDINVEY